MGDIYRTTQPDGKVVYSDRPEGPGRSVRLDEHGRVQEQEPALDHEAVKQLIKELQKRAVKANDCLAYLRNHRPHQLDRVLLELKQSDPEAWLSLQKYPQFRPLHQTTLGLKAAEKHATGLIGLAGGKVGGSLEGWLETTVKDMMKRDRWGPYADVLGSKASTLPSKPATYSNSRLGQYLKVEDARSAQAAAAVTKEAEGARAALRAAKATAVSRGLNPLLDLGIAALDPDVGTGVRDGLVLGPKIKHLYDVGVLDEEQWAKARQLLSEGRIAELDRLITQATARFIGPGR